MEVRMVAVLSLIVVLLIGLGYVVQKSRDKDNPIELDDLLLERGPDGEKQLSKIGFYMLGAFLVSAWVIVVNTMKGTLSDIEYGAFLTAWVGPLVAAMFKGGGK